MNGYDVSVRAGTIEDCGCVTVYLQPYTDGD